jgi:hypothetical protein
MFIDDNDLVEIKIHYRKQKKLYNACTEKEFNALKEDEKKKFSNILTIQMKNLNWGLFNDLQDQAMVEGVNGEHNFNFRIYKENRLKKLIKSWDATDKDSKPVPVNDSAISHLSPMIAEAIYRAYDEASMLTEEEEGKS